MRRSFMAVSNSLIISVCVAAVATASVPSLVHAQSWSFGVRGEFMALGGDQFATLSGGYGGSGFIRRQVGDLGGVELGKRITRHRLSLVCFTDDCIRYVHRTLTEGYVRPVIQPTLPGTSIRPYVGLEVGVMTGEFQDASPGLSVGGAGGFAIPFSRRLAMEVGLTGTMIYVGTDLPRSAWGRRFNLQLGLTVR